VPFAVDNSLDCSGYSPLFRERDRDTPLFVASLWQTSRFCRSPTTSVVSYWSDITGRRRGGRGSGASSHHGLNTLANGSYQYYFLCRVPGPQAIGNKLKLRILEILWAAAWMGLLTIIRLSLHHYLESLALPRLLRLHARAALHPRTAALQ